MDLGNALIHGWDMVIIFLFIAINILTYKRVIPKCSSLLLNTIVLILFVVGFPLLSIDIEMSMSLSKQEFKTFDSFNYWYCYFKFPLYWFLGVMQLISYKIIYRRV